MLAKCEWSDGLGIRREGAPPRAPRIARTRSLQFIQAAPKITLSASSCLVPFLSSFGEQLHDDGRDSRRHISSSLIRGDRLSRDMTMHPFHRIGCREGKSPSQHFVKRNSERIEIAPGINRAIHTSSLLWCHVSKCPGDRLGRLGGLALAWEPRCDPKPC